MLHGVTEALARHHPEQSCGDRGPWVCVAGEQHGHSLEVQYKDVRHVTHVP